MNKEAWCPNLNKAYIHCFDYDLSSAIACSFKKKEKNLGPRYLPFVRIMEAPNVAASDVRKFEWDLESHSEDDFSRLRALSQIMPDTSPQALGMEVKVVAF